MPIAAVKDILRPSERLWAVYFLYVSLLGLWRAPSLPFSALSLIAPLALIAIARADSVATHRRWSILRDWAPTVLILVAYWSIDWAPGPSRDRQLEDALITWDRVLLDRWHLRLAIEGLGVLIPSMLEIAYLLVYAVLPLTIAWFYVGGRRERLDDFVFPFVLGTLATYALLPHFPSEAPRFVYAGDPLPVETVFRHVNIWILDQADIRSSVFPSGHVAVGFSAAFALRLAVPGRRALGNTLLVIATLVWISTVYGRYHYAGDGLAALASSAVSIAVVFVRRASPHHPSVRAAALEEDGVTGDSIRR